MFGILNTEQLFVTNVWVGGMMMSEAMRAAKGLYNDPAYYCKSEVRIRNNKRRRQRIVRRQYILLGISTAIVLFFCILMATTVMSSAQSDNYEPTFKYYKTITVHADDTLLEIADEYYSSESNTSFDEYIGEICSINALSDANSLKAGEELIIPYFSHQYK